MTAELSLTVKRAGYGVSTGVAMGGDRITGRAMVEYVCMFEADERTDAILCYGEPGSSNEAEPADNPTANGVTKPIIGILAGAFPTSAARRAGQWYDRKWISQWVQ